MAPAAAGSMAMSASVLVAWCLCSGARMFLNKAVYSTGYRYPFAVTGLSQAFALLCAWALVQARAVAYRPCGSWRQYARTAMPAAAASVATLYTGNVAVMMLPVTFVQIVKGLTPSVTLLLAVLLRQERLSAPLVATVGAISAGSALSCARQGSLPGFSWLGFVFQVLACVSEALRAIAIKGMRGSRAGGLNLAEAIIALAAPCAAMLLAMSALFEAPGSLQQLPELLQKHSAAIIGTVTMSFLTDLTCYLALMVTSSLTFKVAGVAKNVATMAIGVSMGERLTAMQVAGYAVASGATVMYSTLRRPVKPPPSKHE